MGWFDKCVCDSCINDSELYKQHINGMWMWNVIEDTRALDSIGVRKNETKHIILKKILDELTGKGCLTEGTNAGADVFGAYFKTQRTIELISLPFTLIFLFNAVAYRIGLRNLWGGTRQCRRATRAKVPSWAGGTAVDEYRTTASFTAFVLAAVLAGVAFYDTRLHEMMHACGIAVVARFVWVYGSLGGYVTALLVVLVVLPLSALVAKAAPWLQRVMLHRAFATLFQGLDGPRGDEAAEKQVDGFIVRLPRRYIEGVPIRSRATCDADGNPLLDTMYNADDVEDDEDNKVDDQLALRPALQKGRGGKGGGGGTTGNGETRNSSGYGDWRADSDGKRGESGERCETKGGDSTLSRGESAGRPRGEAAGGRTRGVAGGRLSDDATLLYRERREVLQEIKEEQMRYRSHPQNMRGNVGSAALICNGMAARWSTTGDPDSLLQFVDPAHLGGAWEETARQWGSTCMKNPPAHPSGQTKKKKKRGSSEVQYGASYRGQCQFQRRFGSNADEQVGADNKDVQCRKSFNPEERRTGYRGRKILCGRCHHYFCFEHFTGHEVNNGVAPVTCDKIGYTPTHSILCPGTTPM